MNIAARIVPIFTLPKISDVKSPQMIKDNTTIDVSKHTLTLENRLLYAKDMASTTPSLGRGAMFAGIYIKIPAAIKNILTISSVKLTSKGRPGIGDKIHSERSVKYPNITVLINCKSLFALNLFFKIGICKNTRIALKIIVVIPIFAPEASVKE